MLQELRIKNFAIIDELSLSFSRGLNIITGETGAGKSIILNAVHLLLGDKATNEMIRTSEEEAMVEALFDISKNLEVKERLKERLPKLSNMDEECLIIRRIISRSGRGRVMINENITTLSMLSEIGERLLSIYGQHEHQTLQRVETHIDILDEFGGLLGLRVQFQKEFEKFISLSDEIRRIKEEREKKEKDHELMRFQLREIEASKLAMGEEESLKEERKVLINAKRLMEFSNLSEAILYSDNSSALERIQSILKQGHELVSIDPSISDIIKTLENVSIQLEEAITLLRNYSKRIESNPQRLEEIDNRLMEIEGLKRKYGHSIDDIFLFKKKIEEAIRSFDSSEGRLSQLEGILESIQGEVFALAKKLSWERSRVALELKRFIERELGSLGMKKTTFKVLIEEATLSPKGMDRVEFLISPNIGEEVKPLAKIASGGELSRIMLAIKKILANVGGRQSLIFDEVDSGIGGAIAEVVGRKLKELSKYHQVICVTHLPQIACYADNHHSVRKEIRSGRTVTMVHQLEKEAVIDEIARMLGGVKITEKTRDHAKEMIEYAKRQ